MMNRREWLERSAAVPAALAALQSETPMEAAPLLRPKALARGMRVALIAPSSHLFVPDRYEQALDRMRSLGFDPFFTEHAREQYGYLAGSDDARAADLNGAFVDPRVDAIWCVRGGYGALRILPTLDYAAIRRNPKPFIGYSDVTALHLAIQKRSRVVTFHGPMPSSDFDPYAVSELERVLMTKGAAGVVGATPSTTTLEPGRVEKQRCFALREGRAEGPLLGGNMSLVTRLLGTPFEPDFSGAILFLEDVGEATYRIDGMMAQLWLAGVFQRCAGLVFGRFTKDENDQPVQLSTEAVLREYAAKLTIPVLYGLCLGHVDVTTTLPYGVKARLDTGKRSLELVESAVS